MITLNINKGELHITGEMVTILTEYTIITSTVIKQLENIYDKETAFKVLAALGQLAIMDTENNNNPDSVYEKIIEVLENEIKI